MTTEILGLDEILGSQANKYITHNDALHQIEGRTVRVLSRTTTAQPVSPAAGDTYIIPAGATGTDWSTFAAGDIAHYYGGGWSNWPPIEGIRVWVNDEDKPCVWDGSGWDAMSTAPKLATVSKTADYTIQATERGAVFLVDASAGAVTITLPDSSAAGDGFVAGVVKTDSSANMVTIQAAGANLINGASSLAIGNAWSGTLLDTDGAGQWVEVGGGGGSGSGSGVPSGAIVLFESVENRDGYDPIAASQKLYLLQGGGTSGFYEYDIDTATFTALASLPVAATNGAGCAVVGDKVYAQFGGGGPTGKEFSEYDISSNTWATKNALPVATGSYGWLVSDGSTLYRYPGSNDPAHIYKYDPVADGWTLMPTAPKNLYSGGAAIVGRTLYVAEDSGSQNLLAFDLDAETWSILSAPPWSSFGFALAADSTMLYLLRGAGNDFSVYGIVSGSWTTQPDAPDDAVVSSAALVSEIAYFIGDSTLLRYGIVSGSWSSVPFPTNFGNSGAGIASRVQVKQNADGYYYYRKL